MRQDAQRQALGLIALVGVLLYLARSKPEGDFSSTIIPLDEPTSIDWAESGGEMFFT